MIIVPIEVEVCTLPHFKGPVNGKVEPIGPEYGGIYIFQNIRLKTGDFHHKLSHFDFDMHTTVAFYCSKNRRVDPNNSVGRDFFPKIYVLLFYFLIKVCWGGQN